MKKSIALTFLAGTLFLASYCNVSAQTDNNKADTLPEFVLGVGDIGVHQNAEIIPPTTTQTNYTVSFCIDWHQKEMLRKFSQEHLHQRVQLVLEGKVLGELYLTNEISNGVFDLSVKTREEADQIARDFNHA
jgi:preprotein translocase subunit SecD